MLDLILDSPTILDGTGAPGFVTDIGVVGNRIALIANLSDREARMRLACKGLIVAPGFIDPSGRTDAWLAQPRGENKLLQGVTTEIGRVPFRGPHWDDVDGLFRALESARPCAHLACIVESGDAALVRNARDQGALDLTLRDIDRDAPFIQAVASEIERVPMSQSHHIPSFVPERARSRLIVHDALAAIDRAREHGLDLHVDVAPYRATWRRLLDLIPGASRGTRDTLLAHLDEVDTVAALALALRLRYDDHWKEITISGVGDERLSAACGMTIEDFASARRHSPALAMLTLLREAHGNVDAFDFAVDEDDVATVLSADFACVATHAPVMSLRSDDWSLPHPRAFGAFPRFFNRFVRQRRVLSIEEAVRRVTSSPAAWFGLRERGRIAPHWYADMVIFDESAFADRATYRQPRAHPDGIAWVIVDGEVVVRDGMHSGARPGRILRHGIC